MTYFMRNLICSLLLILTDFVSIVLSIYIALSLGDATNLLI